MKTPEFVIFGIDACTWEVLEYMFNRKMLPALGYIADEGITGKLRTTLPPLSPSAWNSIFTGLDVPSHKIVDFVRINSDYTLDVETEFYRPWSLWTIMEDAGKRGVIFNVPFSKFAMNLSPGTVVFSGISGPLRASGRILNVDELENDVKKRFPDHWGEMFLFSREAFVTGIGDEYFKKFFARLRHTVRHREEIIDYLIKAVEPDYVIVVFSDVDMVQHYGWYWFERARRDGEVEGNPLLEVYSLVDGVLLRLLENFGDGPRYYVVSDHGAGKVGANFAINAFLARAGVLSLKKGAKRFKRLYEVFNVWKSRGVVSLSRRAVTTIYLLSPFKKFIQKLLINAGKNPIELPTSSFWDFVDWENTTAVSYGMGGCVYLHDGRFSMGTLREGERSEVVERLKNILLEVDACREVHIPEFQESNKILPDVILEMREGYGIELDPTISSDFSPFTGGSNHYPSGTFMVKGDGIELDGKTKSELELRACDFLPTFLELEGISVDVPFDGKPVLKGTGEKKSIKVSRRAGEEVLTGEEEEAILSRLRELGYVD